MLAVEDRTATEDPVPRAPTGRSIQPHADDQIRVPYVEGRSEFLPSLYTYSRTVTGHSSFQSLLCDDSTPPKLIISSSDVPVDTMLGALPLVRRCGDDGPEATCSWGDVGEECEHRV